MLRTSPLSNETVPIAAPVAEPSVSVADPNEIHKFQKIANNFTCELAKIIRKKREAVDKNNALTNLQAVMIVEFYAYLLTVPHIFYLYPRYKTTYVNQANAFKLFIQITREYISEETKEIAITILDEFCTMCK